VEWRIRMQRASGPYPDSLRQLVKDSRVDVAVNDVFTPYIDIEVAEANLWSLDGTYVHEMCRAINDNFTIACTEDQSGLSQNCRRVQVTCDAPGARLALPRLTPPVLALVPLHAPRIGSDRTLDRAVQRLIETEMLFRMAMLAEKGRGVLFLQSKPVDNQAQVPDTRCLSSARAAFYQNTPTFDAIFENVPGPAGGVSNEWIVTLTAAPGTVLLADTQDAVVDKYAWKPDPDGNKARNIVTDLRDPKDVKPGVSRKRSVDSIDFTRKEIRGLFDTDDDGKPRSSEASSTDTRDTLPIPLRIELHIRRVTPTPVVDDDDEEEEEEERIAQTATYTPQKMKVGGWFFKDRASQELSRGVFSAYKKESTAAERETQMKEAMVPCTRIASAYSAAVTQEHCIVAFGADVIGAMQTALENAFLTQTHSDLDADEHNEFRNTAMKMLQGVSEIVPATVAIYGSNPIAPLSQRQTNYNATEQFELESTEAYLRRV
jgi:hypothetical protein